MRRIAPGQLACWLILPFCCHAFAASSPGDDLLALPLEALTQLEVSIATGTPKPLTATPAATSVITARELEAMGAQDIGDALEAVPGLHVSNGSFQYAPRYFMRGIVSTYNPHTLVLLNGVPQTSLFLGDRGERLPGVYSLPVKLLDRIEIIRGPGSALYGADAFAGVVNLITKSPLDIRGGELHVGAGSFDTQRATLLQSAGLGQARALFSLAWLRTDGDDDAVIARDAVGGFSPAASQAPHAAATGVRSYDLRGDIAAGDFRLRLGLMQAWDVGTGQGINDALDPANTFEHRRGNLDLGWQSDDLAEHWVLGTRLSYLYGEFRNDRINLFPPGTCFPTTPPSCFPEGMWGSPNLYEENARSDLDALYTGFESHRLRFGGGFFWGDIFKTTDRNNYLPELLPQVRPQPVDVSDTAAVFQPENQRTSHYLFTQDEWALAPDWELTAGLRYDRYSDVGDTTNPRLSLVWNTLPALTSKLIYGEAFRPPAFLELYGTSNPVALGNPALRPEKLKSLELALCWKPSATLSWDLNLYALRIRDFIDFVNDPGQPTFTARNTARIRGQGLETELRQQFGDNLQLLANYSRQRTRDQNGAPLGLAPREEAHVRGTWSFASRWQLGTQLNWAGERERQAGDPRADLAGYVTADLSLRRLLDKHIDLALSTRNLFDADVREPSRGPAPGQLAPSLPEDLPQAGRSLFLELGLRW
jgi:iron complex outermembrane receptor protein